MTLSLLKSVWNREAAAGRSATIPHVALPTAKSEDGTEDFTNAVHAVDVDPTAAADKADATVDYWIIPTRSMAQYALTNCNLTDDELAHARSIKREDARVRYIAVRSLLRTALSHSVKGEIESGQWQFETNEFGKPVLRLDNGTVSFSITHACTFSVVAVTSDATLGIDAEKVDGDRIKHLPIDCFTAKEQRHLNATPEKTRHFDFFRLWTLKEAYSKALGLGFSAEFDKIQFALKPLKLERKSPQAAAEDTESFDLLSLSFDGATFFLATCLLNAKRRVRSMKRTVRVVGA